MCNVYYRFFFFIETRFRTNIDFQLYDPRHDCVVKALVKVFEDTESNFHNPWTSILSSMPVTLSLEKQICLPYEKKEPYILSTLGGQA